MTAGRVTALNWGVKQSFRSYVEATGGTIAAGDGAERAADGGFTFALAPGGDLALDADGRPQGHAKFSGEVRFEAHGGMLSVRLADLELQFDPAGATLTVADVGDRRAAIAQLDLAAMTIEAGEIVIPAALSMDGIQLLGDHYPLRTPLDPVRLTLATS